MLCVINCTWISQKRNVTGFVRTSVWICQKLHVNYLEAVVRLVTMFRWICHPLLVNIYHIYVFWSQTPCKFVKTHFAGLLNSLIFHVC